MQGSSQSSQLDPVQTPRRVLASRFGADDIIYIYNISESHPSLVRVSGPPVRASFDPHARARARAQAQARTAHVYGAERRVYTSNIYIYIHIYISYVYIKSRPESQTRCGAAAGAGS